MRKRENGTCTYCGAIGEVTREHVVPRCLFSPMPKLGVLLVPVCKKCNSEDKAKLDEYFRDRLVIDSMVQEHPTVRRIRQGTYKRSVDKNQSKLTRVATTIATKRDVTHNGMYRGSYTVVFANEDRQQQEIEFIVRGLSFLLNQQRLDDSCFIDVVPIKQFAGADAMLELHQTTGLSKAFDMGQDSEFLALYSKNTSEGLHVVWAMLFYGAIVCIAVVMDVTLKSVVKDFDKDQQAGIILSDLIR